MGADGYQFNEICEGDILTNTYSTNTTGGLNTWYVFGDTLQSQNIILEWTNAGFYTFSVTTEENGCVSYPSYFDVALSQCPQELIFIPNTFTPDDDEFNQSWLPIFTEGFDPYDYNLLVFNRWGETIFESNNHQIGWLGDYRGKECMEGTYTWRIEFGNLVNDARKVITGHLTLIR
jgi:gliding motility-associated-like protein